MSLVSSIYYGTNLLEKMGIDVGELRSKFTNMVQDYATNLVNNIPADSINDKIRNVELDANLSPDEIVERNNVVDTFASIIESAGGEEDYQNIVQAIRQEPEAWGQVLANAHVDGEILENMQTSIANGESVTWDVVKLAYGSSAGVIGDFTDKYATPQDGNNKSMESAEANNTKEQQVTETKEERVSKAMALFNLSSEGSDKEFGDN